MCGIFGAIGKNINPGIIRALALANRERGTHSFGLFGSDGNIVKAAHDPLKCLGMPDFNAYIEGISSTGWFIAGHTRYATTGAIVTRNAHPFKYGNITGAHNGMVEFPRNRKYAVDSEYLFDLLNEHKGNYQTALAGVDGYWGLSWFDGDSFYLQAHSNTICAVRAESGMWYYSSDGEHLAACVGYATEVRLLEKGATIRFCGPEAVVQDMPVFKSTAIRLWDTSKTAKHGGGKKSKKQRKQEKLKWRDEPRTTIASATFPRTTPADYDVTAHNDSWLSSDESRYLDELSRKAGYKDGADFMEAEGIRSENQALTFLEDCAYASGEGYDRYEVWDDYVNGN